MAINHEKKLIFIHIPKTAGTSIYKSMGVEDISYRNKFLGHKSIEEYKKQYENYWSDYLKFTVVRDPIDRFISAYNYNRMQESFWHSSISNKKPKNSHYEICNRLDINQYVEYLYMNPEKHCLHTLPQLWFIKDEHEKISVEYIAKYENLNNDLKKIGISVTEKLNVSTIKNMSSSKLTKNSEKMIKQMYQIDYNFFYPNKHEKTFSYS